MPILAEILADAHFAETVSVVPAGGGAAISITARVRREEVALDDREDGRYQVSRATVAVLVSALAAPAVGDSWTLARYKGGPGAAGWMAGPATGRDGAWEIPVELRERLAVGRGPLGTQT